ncbi:MAG: hypothetical protein ACI9FU_001456 [Granulosicoccus sp.]|jgi:hypothetical protein
MRNLLNTGWHFLAKKLEKYVNISKEEFEMIADKTEAISSELKEWAGEGEHELISIGQNCNSSWYIKETDQKKASYPFDWIATSPEILIDILKDDFRKFLDKEQMISKGFRAGHKVYHSDMYGHRNPVKSKSDLAYFERGVSRWRQMMAEQRPALLITTVVNEPNKRPLYSEGFVQEMPLPQSQNLEDFKDVIALFQSKNPNFKFLFIEQYTEKEFKFEILNKSDVVCWLRFDSIGSNTGVKYLNSIDEQVMKSVVKAIGNKE